MSRAPTAILYSASKFAPLFPDSDVADVVSKRKAQICNEIADIAIYLNYLAHDLEVDLDDCVQKKLLLNEEKYPVEKSKGHATKYDRLR